MEMESERLLSLPVRASFARPSAVDPQIKKIQIDLRYLKQCFRY